MRPTWMATLAVLALVAAGCGDARSPLAPVRGHVFFRGAPLRGAAVVFTPDPEHGGRGPLACARLGDDGGYVLVTGQDFGAVAGWHRDRERPVAQQVVQGDRDRVLVVDREEGTARAGARAADALCGGRGGASRRHTGLLHLGKPKLT